MIEMVNNHHKKAFLKISTDHSIGYFVSDSIYSLISKKYTYLIHHIISILMLSSVYFDSYISASGLLYAELGGFFHHLKRLYKDNNIIKIVYFIMYGYTRGLMLTNAIVYFFKDIKIIDRVQVVLLFPLIFQNLFWLWKNFRKDNYLATYNLKKHKEN